MLYCRGRTYDFDSRWDEELASLRQKRIMDQFALRDELYSFELKRLAGFGKKGEKNFEGTVTDLQMGGYLLIRDFRQRLNKKGLPYGWPISVYATPETLWGCEHIASAYSMQPEQSEELVYQQVQKNFPAATEAALQRVLGWDRRVPESRTWLAELTACPVLKAGQMFYAGDFQIGGHGCGLQNRRHPGSVTAAVL